MSTTKPAGAIRSRDYRRAEPSANGCPRVYLTLSPGRHVKHNPTMNRDTVLTQWSGTIKSMNTPYVVQHGYGMPTDDRTQRSIDMVKRALKIDAAFKPNDLFAKISN